MTMFDAIVNNKERRKIIIHGVDRILRDNYIHRISLSLNTIYIML